MGTFKRRKSIFFILFNDKRNKIYNMIFNNYRTTGKITIIWRQLLKVKKYGDFIKCWLNVFILFIVVVYNCYLCVLEYDDYTRFV